MSPAKHPPSPGIAALAIDLPLRDARKAFEQAYFRVHMSREGFSITRLVKSSGLDRSSLYRKLNKLGFAFEAGRWCFHGQPLQAQPAKR